MLSPGDFHVISSLLTELSVTFGWTPRSHELQYTITIEYKVSTAVEWNITSRIHQDETKYTVHELKPNTKYAARIFAENKFGRSEVSPVVFFSTIATLPTG